MPGTDTWMCRYEQCEPGELRWAGFGLTPTQAYKDWKVGYQRCY